MTTPDEAMLWARKQVAATFIEGGAIQAQILSGELDHYHQIQQWAWAYRAGQSAYAERVAVQNGALQDIADLTDECVGVPIDSEACQYWALIAQRAIDTARGALEGHAS